MSKESVVYELIQSNELNSFSTSDINYGVPITDLASNSILGICIVIAEGSRGILFPTLVLNVHRMGGTMLEQGFAIVRFLIIVFYFTIYYILNTGFVFVW